MNDIAADKLRSYVDRLVRLNQELREREEDIRSVYAEAQEAGIDKTALGLHVKKQVQQARGLQVYFAAFPQAKLLKIGISRDPRRRVADLSFIRGEAGAILLTLPGIYALEGWYHLQFSPWRVYREWFALNAETEALVEEIGAPARQ